jgi:hypothetical protein
MISGKELRSGEEDLLWIFNASDRAKQYGFFVGVTNIPISICHCGKERICQHNTQWRVVTDKQRIF